jgi:hypothetical protein
MKTITRLEPMSVMRIAALVQGLFGLLEGAFFSMVFLLVPFARPNGPQMPRVFGVFFGALAIVFLPIMFAVMGAILGGLGAVVYNVAAKYVGGIQVDVE